MKRKKGKQGIAGILKPYLITIIAAAGAMVFLMLFWHLKGDKIGRGAKDEVSLTESTSDVEDNESELVSVSLICEPEYDDGTGKVGIMECTDEMLAVSNKAGRHSSDAGQWYSPADGYCYYNGWVTLDDELYHFDSDGYMDIGWTAIGGEGCYFDESGIYIEDKDSSMLIALTFDDGPSLYTSDVLDILEQYNIQATFMMLGMQIEKYGDVISRMVAAGHTIGNHTYSHIHLSESTTDEAIAQFSATDSLLEEYGVTSSVIRFPYGDYTSELLTAVNKPQIYWDVDSRDWESQDPETIITTIYSELQPGCIVLMHDIYAETVEALGTLLPSLIADGYEPVNIETLAASKGYTLDNGVTYYSFKQSNIERGTVTDE